jgi:hypothetical protein
MRQRPRPSPQAGYNMGTRFDLRLRIALIFFVLHSYTRVYSLDALQVSAS